MLPLQPFWLLPPATTAVGNATQLPSQECVPVAKARACIGGRSWQRPTCTPCSRLGATHVGTYFVSPLSCPRPDASAPSPQVWRVPSSVTEKVTSGWSQSFVSFKELGVPVCVSLCFIKPILGNHYGPVIYIYIYVYRYYVYLYIHIYI